ncbi:hypothetical protein [Glutamicibacter ardleyensis]|uniref:hypothetical protein n=1 Tax=Glutamicibacter ardleyensis TaxID=225894 RepID=UPI003FCF1D32
MSQLQEAEIIVDDAGLASSPRSLGAVEARELTDKIRRTLEFTWDMVATAYKGQAWSVLGYASWDEYCTREFGSQHIAIPREERQEIVSSLRESGLSLRAISTVSNLSYGTVRNELSKSSEESGEQNCSPEDTEQKVTPKIEGRDGKFYDRADPKPAAPAPTTVTKSEATFDENQLPEDGGIFPLDATEVLDRNAKARVQNVQRLTGSSGKYSQAPLPLVIQLAGQIAHTSAGADDLDLEESTALVDNGSRAVLVLSQVLKTVDTTVIADAVTKQKIRANLNDAMNTIDEVLTLLEEG